MTDDRTQIVSRSSTVEIGTELNQTYRIDSLIGVGGMGEVFKGHNIQTGDPVAIKVVLPEYARDEMIFELFRKEARVLNHLSHDAIVRYYVFSLDRALGRPYLAMEFVDGPSLAERAKSKPLSQPDFFNLLRHLADGLHKAHEAGVIHRDISPDNVILPGGLVENAKIIDFGIARSATVGGGTLLGGSFAGKYSYVSPEQLGLYGGEVTPKSDIYSLGLTMAAGVRGQPIDMSGSQVEVIEKRRKVPDLASFEIPQELRSILTSMLQPDPANRPASMAEVRDWVDKEQAKKSAKPGNTKSANTGSKRQVPNQTSASLAAQNANVSKSGAFGNTALILGFVSIVAVGVLGGWIYVQNQQQPTTELTQQAANTSLPLDAHQGAIAESESVALNTQPQANALPVPTQETNPPTQQVTSEQQPKVPPSPVVKVPSADATPSSNDVKVASSNPVQQPSPTNPPQGTTLSTLTDSAKRQPTISPSNQVVKVAPIPAQPQPAPVTTSAPKMDIAALTTYVSNYGGNGCLKSEIISLSETSVKLSLTGTDASRNDFQRDFVIKSGFSPDITFHPVTEEQCLIFSTLSKLPQNSSNPIQVKLDRTEIKGNQTGQSVAGDALNVTVTNIGDRNVYLFVVDAAGGILNVNRSCPNCIKMKSGNLLASLSLSPPVDVNGAAPTDLPMFIFAIAASKPLLALNDQDAFESDAFVEPLLQAAKNSDGFAAQSAYVTLKGN
jgi:eukaryotic-like serine/threonine-protein kinase